jgi:hypothetical protein
MRDRIWEKQSFGKLKNDNLNLQHSICFGPGKDILYSYDLDRDNNLFQGAAMIDILKEERIVSRKDIMRIITPMYDIYTWQGALEFFKKNKLPLRYTPSGRPFFFKHELVNYDQKFQQLLTSK